MEKSNAFFQVEEGFNPLEDWIHIDSRNNIMLYKCLLVLIWVNKSLISHVLVEKNTEIINLNKKLNTLQE